jgi:PST family polysaccharide transporter
MVSNAAVLIGGQVLGLIAPLITVPYLARTLGPAAWGPVILGQALANWLILILEFAFDLSGAREVARSRHTPDSMPAVVHGVQSAKALLVVATVPVAWAIALFVPGLRAAPTLVWGAIVFALARGLSPLWYFQGVERVRGAVAVDSLAKVAAALGVFWLVTRPEHAWKVLWLQAAFGMVALAWLSARLHQDVGLRRPQIAAGRAALRDHAAMFACRAASGIYIQANALILGALAPATVAFFGGAERIIRAAINMLQPVNQAVMPRVSFLQHRDAAAADTMVRRSFVVMGMIGLTMASVAFFAAPLLVRLLLGAQYGTAVPLLRLMAALPLLVSINGVLGIFWAVPFGRERQFLMAIVAAGVTNLILAVVLVPTLGPAGMAIAAVMAEVVVFAFLITAYLRR